MDAHKRLKRIFPDVNDETILTILSPLQRIKVGTGSVELKRYEIAPNTFVTAAFVKEINIIFLMFFDYILEEKETKENSKEQKEISDEK